MKRYLSRTSSTSFFGARPASPNLFEKGRYVFERTGAAVGEQQDSKQSPYLHSQLRGMWRAPVMPTTTIGRRRIRCSQPVVYSLPTLVPETKIMMIILRMFW